MLRGTTRKNDFYRMQERLMPCNKGTRTNLIQFLRCYGDRSFWEKKTYKQTNKQPPPPPKKNKTCNQLEIVRAFTVHAYCYWIANN